MSKVSPFSVARVVRTAVQAVSAAILAAPVVIAGLGLSAGKAAAVEASLAALVAGVSAAQNMAEDFGVLPTWLRFDLPAVAAPVPGSVAAGIARAETVAKAVAPVVEAVEKPATKQGLSTD